MSEELFQAFEETKLLRGFNKTELKNDKNVNKALDIIQQALFKANEQEKELQELLDILKNKPFILQRIFEEKGLKNQEEFDRKYFWGTIAGEEEFKIMRWLDGKETNTNEECNSCEQSSALL